MNGQLNHLIRTVESLKKYLEHGEENIKEKASYIESVNFLMPVDSSKCNSFEEEIELKEMDPREYMENLAERRCRGIYIVLEIGKEDRNLSAFANGNKGHVYVCDFGEGYEVWKNSFNHNGKKWNVSYEMIGKKNEKYLPEKRDIDAEYESLIKAYDELSKFANEIEEEHWAKYFESGRDRLLKVSKDERKDIDSLLRNLNWPFGGMGSWNDIYARDERYDEVSDRLYEQVHRTVEAVING